MIDKQNTFQEIFTAQKNNLQTIADINYKGRIQKLKLLKQALETTYRNEICAALYSDLKKPETETELTEIYPVISEIKFAIKNLRKWTKKKKVPTPLSLIGSTSWVYNEPKGVCLLISPWNFPLNLTFGPLVSAIAAGNSVIIKPSELSPRTSEVMSKIVSTIFNSNEISLVQGDASVSKELLQLPFHHIFFTGSPDIGKLIMKAAATHLSSVTLELGGKSPTIIDKTADINMAAKRIAWGKFLNSGQVCVAPDYILLPEKMEEKFIQELKKHIISLYGTNAESSDSYSRIINAKHFNRLVKHIKNAKNKKAIIAYGGEWNAVENYISPTVISNVPEDTTLVQEEIFGPILPIITYKNLEEAIGYIQTKEKPLALYIFSNSNNNIEKIIKNTRAGSTCINHVVLQYNNHNLPFGGSNTSGIGKAHGYHGFLEFSNVRSILKQHTKSTTELLSAPYTEKKKKLAKATIKWF